MHMAPHPLRTAHVPLPAGQDPSAGKHAVNAKQGHRGSCQAVSQPMHKAASCCLMIIVKGYSRRDHRPVRLESVATFITDWAPPPGDWPTATAPAASTPAPSLLALSDFGKMSVCATPATLQHCISERPLKWQDRAQCRKWQHIQRMTCTSRVAHNIVCCGPNLLVF